VPGGVRPIRVRSVLMYTIKILQRLLDRGTHNSIFAFVLLILKNHFQRASSWQQPSRPPSPPSEPCDSIAEKRASRLPPLILTPAPSCDTAETPTRKENFQKPDYQRTRRPNCADALFFN
jgi:hypothetical protein